MKHWNSATLNTAIINIATLNSAISKNATWNRIVK